MNKLIKNYIYAVIRRVDNSKKEEIAKELESNIYDMLGEDTSNENIEKVLKEIGSPIVVAHKYQDNQKHIIHPMFYYDYLTALKLVFIFSLVISILGSVIAIFTSNFNPSDINGELSDLIVNIIDGAFESLLNAFVIVTVVFWIITFNIDKPKMQDFLNNFKVKDMLDAPDDLFQKGSSKLSIYLETILGSAFTLFFALVFVVFYESLGVYEDGVFITGALNNDYRLLLSLIVMGGVLIYLASQVYYAIRLKKDNWFYVIEVIHSVYSIITVVVLMYIANLLNPDFVSYLANSLNKPVAELTNIFNYVLIGIFTVVIIASFVEIVLKSIKIAKKTIK